MRPTRDEAWQLLCRYTETEALRRHALQVEAAMRHFATLFDEDPEAWGLVGLCHDLDYEQFPEQHCVMTKKILTQEGWEEEDIRAIMAHGWGMVTDVEPRTPREKALYTVDELTGIINAACLVRPSHSVHDLTVKSLRKKFKDARFAAGCNREVITRGAQMLGMELDTVMAETIKGLQARAQLCGLQGDC